MMPPVLLAVFAATSADAAPRTTLAGGALVIESDSNCPSAEAVKQALLSLRPDEDLPSTTISIYAREELMVVSLGPGAAGQRRLPLAPDCVTRAATIAVVIATWTNELPAQAVISPGLQPSSSRPPVPRIPEELPAIPRPRHREIGTGLLAAVGGGVAPGVRAEFISLPADSGLGWQACLALPAARELALGGGKTLWTRAAVGLALHARQAGRWYFLSGSAGLAVAYTLAWGQGYALNQTDQSLTYGAAAGVRAGLPWKRWRVWTDLQGGRWLFGQSVQIDADAGGRAASVSLPPWDIQWALGTSYTF